jgi:small ligand-binding sensory domain FIST
MSRLSTFLSAHSEGDDWATIAKQLEIHLSDLKIPEEGYSHLGFLYVTEVLSEDFSSIHTYLSQRTEVKDWVGSVGRGITVDGREFFDRPAAGVMVMTLPTNAFAVLPVLKQDMEEIPTDIRHWMKHAMPPFGVVHGDPMNSQISALIEALSQEIENLTLEVPGFLVGGLAASHMSEVQAAGSAVEGGLSGVLFTPEIEVATGLSQGCAPVAASHRISECMDNVIMALDDEVAIDVFKRDIGELLARDLRRVNGYIHAAFPVEGSDTGDYTVRDLMGIDVARGWLAVGQEVHIGDRILFVRRDPKSAERDLGRMVENLLKRLPEPPRAALYFSCIARGPSLFGDEGVEAGIIQNLLGDIPLVGFYGNGEISNNRLYGYTGVLTLFI